MAFRATNVIQSDGYLRLKRTATALKENLDGFIVQMQATDTDYNRLYNIYLTLWRADQEFDELADIPGIAGYARDQEDDPAYDVVTEGQAMQDEVQTTLNWMEINTIVDNRTAIPVADWPNNTGISLIADTFTPAEIQPLINRLQNVSDTIV